MKNSFPRIFRYSMLLISFGLTGLQSVSSQTIFNMANALTNECKGILLDSEAGQTTGHYDHDENFTFSICVPGASSVSLNFSSFCLEDGFDFVRIFNGADTLSPQIGPAYTGTSLPPTITSSGECLTIHFASDANVTCTGWVAQWDANIAEPILPDMSLADITPACSTSSLIVNFSTPIPCDSIVSASFGIDGPLSTTILSANPLGCMNDSTTSAQLLLSPGLNQSGAYSITYQSFFLDQCDSLWTLSTTDSLSVIDCPLEVTLIADTLVVCVGSCTSLFAEVTGGDVSSYQFNWNPPLPNSPGPHTVCPNTNTTYTVTVSDANGSTPATDMVNISVSPIPIMPADLVVCQSDPPNLLMATPPNGWWAGSGITDNWLGEFYPDSAGAGIHTITYWGPNGCAADMQITVQEIDAGFAEAACPSTAAFQLSGFAPGGGSWTGMHVSPSGLFTPPSTSGVFTVSYTANGCTDSKEISIATPVIPSLDTVCESLDPFLLNATPIGGSWTGTGIVDAFGGVFDPGIAGPGAHSLTYSLQGCAANMDLFVKEIFIGFNFVACPEEDPFALTVPQPAGGIWSSTFGGIIDSVNGIFDPGVNAGANFNDTLTYQVDGCEASRIAYVRQTRIYLNPDTLSFCREDTAILLDWWNVQRSPGNGNWVGAGITDPNFPGIFDPFVAGHGTHTLVYTANTCSDSMTMVVYPRSIPTDTAVCEGAPAFAFRSSSPGGIWRGVGIMDSISGIFDPQTAGIGFHRIYYQTPMGCLDSAEIEVYQLPTLQLQNLAPHYCYKDTLYTLQAIPAGGSYSGPGIVGNQFNPVLAGTGGAYLITYTFGSGDCQRSVVGVSSVGPPLEVGVAFDEFTICPGEFVTILASATGGNGAPYRYMWDQGVGVGAEHALSPSDNTRYTVTASDDCSDEVMAQVSITVHPDFQLGFAQSEAVCFGDNGFALAIVEGQGVYSYEWNTQPPQTGDSLFAPTGFGYEVIVTDILTGCQKDGMTEIPRFPFVRASFLPNPNDRCQRSSDPVVQFIDQSTGADSGYWDFGDGTQEVYVFGQNPSHRYDSLGEFLVKLVLTNEGGCADSAIASVCVIPEESGITVPNAFSPNGDGINDEFFLESVGIQTYELHIYDRWGRVIFQSSQPDERWDGRYQGTHAPEGVYTYRIQGTIIANNPLTNYAPRLLHEVGTITLVR
ncbi:MAG: gliding motility-associated C-terminal domain-containing protein [Bacteroidota bacterium]